MEALRRSFLLLLVAVLFFFSVIPSVTASVKSGDFLSPFSITLSRVDGSGVSPVVLRRGESATLKVQAARTVRAALSTIRVRVQGLPSGIKVGTDHVRIPFMRSSGVLEITADSSAPVSEDPITITVVSESDGSVVAVPVPLVVLPSSASVPAAAVAEPGPSLPVKAASLQLKTSPQVVEVGESGRAALTVFVDRAGYDGVVAVSIASALPKGVTVRPRGGIITRGKSSYSFELRVAGDNWPTEPAVSVKAVALYEDEIDNVSTKIPKALMARTTFRLEGSESQSDKATGSLLRGQSGR